MQFSGPGGFPKHARQILGYIVLFVVVDSVPEQQTKLEQSRNSSDIEFYFSVRKTGSSFQKMSQQYHP